MNENHEDYYMRGLRRGIERLAKQQANTASKSASIEPAVTKPVLAKPVLTALQPVKLQATKLEAIKPEFNLEAYRLDIIAKAIAHILKQQKGI
ncbi:hypothetical protein [Pseudomonas sp. Teo4]|uniref:hypothetical protein n=1 Tax=Pseudomonas sp. Teo4 TaxID=3064528 RepID=UPI002ABCFA56|nr:hypothetical protein [Pseudomonas sp. Teo4]MDZ3995400.1 hypothetical protein [Pseudomonas sp. Teo4]